MSQHVDAPASQEQIDALNDNMKNKCDLQNLNLTAYSYSSAEGLSALYTALPNNYMGACNASFQSGFNCSCLVSKHGSYGTILLVPDDDVDPVVYAVRGGTGHKYKINRASY